MNSKIFIIVLIVSIESLNALNAENICYGPKNGCGGKLSYQCSEKFCSDNKDTCNEFNQLRSSINNDEKNKNISLIMNRLKPCPIRTKEWKISNDTCSIGVNCTRIFQFPIRKLYVNIIKAVKCPCRGAFPFDCGQKFCSKNQQACSHFFKMNKNDFKFKKCGNDNIIIQKNNKD